MILYISLLTAKKEKGWCFFTLHSNAGYHLFLPELMKKSFFPMSFSLQEAIIHFLIFLPPPPTKTENGNDRKTSELILLRQGYATVSLQPK